MQSDIRLNFSLNIQTDMTEVADIRLMQGDAQKFSDLGDQPGGTVRTQGERGGREWKTKKMYEYKV